MERVIQWTPQWGVKKAVQDSFSQFNDHYNWIWESERKFYKKDIKLDKNGE